MGLLAARLRVPPTGNNTSKVQALAHPLLAPINPQIRNMSTVNELQLAQLKQLAHGDADARLHVLSLLSKLDATDEEERAWANDALQTIEATPAELAAEIAHQCQNSVPAIAAWACKLVAKLGPESTNYQNFITECLTGHTDLHARQIAALALAQVPQLSASTLVALERAATSDDPRLSRLASTALEKAKA